MDPYYTVLTRINQLEGLVLTQARDIENLKRNFSRIDNRISESANNYHPTRHPYQMNSPVHPPSAIPPGTSSNRTQPNIQNNHRDSNRVRWQSLARTPPPPASSSHNKRWSAAPDLGPTADDVISNMCDSQEFDEPPQTTHKKHGRQSFVESSNETPRKLVEPTRPASDDEDIDVEGLDASGGSLKQRIEQLESQPQQVDRAITIRSHPLSVALVDTKHHQLATPEDEAYDSDEVQEVAVISAKPKLSQSSATKKPLNQVAKFEPGVNISSGSDRNAHRRSKHVRTKTPYKTMPKKNSSGQDNPDQTWIWSKDPNRSQTSLPTELMNIFNKSPF